MDLEKSAADHFTNRQGPCGKTSSRLLFGFPSNLHHPKDPKDLDPYSKRAVACPAVFGFAPVR